MTGLTLKIEKREAGNAQNVREGNKVPAVLYGPKNDSVSISIKHSDFLKTWNEAGESSIITLTGLGEDMDALIQQVDTHPVTGQPLHADFYIIEKGKKVQVEVPLIFEGIAPVEKAGGIVIKVIHELEVEAMPKNLPHEIKVDLSVLTDMDSQILVKDIKLPEGVDVMLEPEEVIVSVSEAKEIEEEEPTAIDMDSIVVEEKGKKEDSPESEEGGE